MNKIQRLPYTMEAHCQHMPTMFTLKRQIGGVTESTNMAFYPQDTQPMGTFSLLLLPIICFSQLGINFLFLLVLVGVFDCKFVYLNFLLVAMVHWAVPSRPRLLATSVAFSQALAVSLRFVNLPPLSFFLSHPLISISRIPTLILLSTLQSHCFIFSQSDSLIIPPKLLLVQYSLPLSSPPHVMFGCS